MFYFRGSFYSIKKQSNVYDECLTHINYIVDDPCTPVDCLHGNCVYNESTGFAKCICNGDYTGSLCESK